jgi:hypothetical protein
MDNSDRKLPETPEIRAALIVAHPGHELLVHSWLERARPRVFVLTDGSGRSNQSRLNSTTKIINQAGATRGRIYGRLTDLSVYSAILNHDFALFTKLATELSEALVDDETDYVVGDAVEGYNPTHDVCRLVINAAIEVASRARGHRLANLDFLVIRQPSACRKTIHAGANCLRLDEDAFARKMAAARGYTELKAEVDAALSRTPVDAFRVECLHPVDSAGGSQRFLEEPPLYEHYGEKQVLAGYYAQVVRYREHIAPLAEALSRYSQRSG